MKFITTTIKITREVVEEQQDFDVVSEVQYGEYEDENSKYFFKLIPHIEEIREHPLVTVIFGNNQMIERHDVYLPKLIIDKQEENFFVKIQDLSANRTINNFMLPTLLEHFLGIDSSKIATKDEAFYKSRLKFFSSSAGL